MHKPVRECLAAFLFRHAAVISPRHIAVAREADGVIAEGLGIEGASSLRRDTPLDPSGLSLSREDADCCGGHHGVRSRVAEAFNFRLGIAGICKIDAVSRAADGLPISTLDAAEHHAENHEKEEPHYASHLPLLMCMNGDLLKRTQSAGS